MKKYFVVVFLLTFFACSETTYTEPDASALGLDYFPIEVGKSWVYQLDSIIYDPEPGEIVVDTISYELKLEVVDTLIDLQNEKIYKLERYTRQSDTLPWTINDVWYVKMDENQVVVNEENLNFIKLVFPVREGQSWDGNALLHDRQVEVEIREETLDLFKLWSEYYYRSVGKPERIGERDYDEVATIEQVDRTIIIEKRLSVEKYARGVGLVYKRMEILDTQNADTSIPFVQRAQMGYIMEMTLKEYN